MDVKEGPALDGIGGTVQSSAIFADLLGDRELQALLGDIAILSHYRQFETALVETKRDLGLVEQEPASEAIRHLARFLPDTEMLADRTARDGVTIAGYVQQLKEELSEEAAAAVHTGATSQDVMDTALTLCLRDVNARLELRLQYLVEQLDNLSARFGDRTVMGRTRMQAALPIKLPHRLENWRRPLRALLEDWARLSSSIEWLQLGGPVGDRRGFDDQADGVASMLAGKLGLIDPGYAWHNDRRPIIAQGEMLARLSGALGKMGQDVALMAQNGIDEVTLSGAGGSSAMAHKSNPVAAEVLVSLARYNAAQSGLLHSALVHEQERSGTAWTLEWMVLPAMCLATGRALLLSTRLLDQIETMGKARDE
ncbi:3-carboxy-cis,cis-muconate cycloisomerase [Notoacmeibacter sp. MSK16QG-6]|uniref:3-carboxy-cis,cis-muconate cycloisomerase n=1 Tax=Notoacmeibacter sp. MSK16QG-6 TaxID=2957982 RepID=UPI00209E0B92|nr:3-carboxy-cis,cis-muconate cycloisomerase [Notoacmeibacter sp. MSK16QG-6]MCP1199601.1 3-carboxy-cis,cis-muconate cycloisomerase [Notoacmeibacter sp. MSK16QG-6]